MEDSDMMMTLPEGMTEQELFEIVRELLGDDSMSEAELVTVLKGGVFQELCPDIEKFWKDRQRSKALGPSNQHSSSGKEFKRDVGDFNHSSQIKIKEESQVPQSYRVESTKAQVKSERLSDSDEESVNSERRSQHKKKKKKHKKEHKKDKPERKEKDRDRDKEKEREIEKAKVKSSEPERPKISLGASKNLNKHDSSSESEDEKTSKHNKHEKEKSKKRVVFISSSSESENDKPKREKDKANGESKVVKTENGEKPKIHSYYQDKRTAELTSSQPQPSTSTKEIQREVERKKEPKPYSKYSRSVSRINLRRWRPNLDKSHLKYQRKFRLKPISITCVDLLDFPMIFRDPNKKSKNHNAVPLKSGLELETDTIDMIRRLERDKLRWFRKELQKQANRSLKGHKRSMDSSDEDKRKYKRVRISDSDSSDSITVGYQNKGTHHKSSAAHDKDKGKGKMSKSEKDAEARRRMVEEIKRKQDKILKQKKAHALPVEKKVESSKNKKDDAREKEKAVAEKKKLKEKLRLERLEQEKHKPSVSFQRVLAQIVAANKQEAAKPKVELKIPKISQQTARPPTEYKIEKRINVGDVAHEVKRLLSSNVKVECPVIPENPDDLGEYTVKKIAWWFLKNEKQPPLEGPFHPECHDEDVESWNDEDDFDWPDDMSSVNGCVSDPEGLTASIRHPPGTLNDPDWIDEYCGCASLDEGRIRKLPENEKLQLESMNQFKAIMRKKPGTNYSKPNLEVKCFICDTIIKGQRQLGAHIRSDAHKNSFRNYTLGMANYEEKLMKVPPKKEFIAKLVEYSINANQSTSSNAPGSDKNTKDNMEKEEHHRVAKIQRVRSDSPGPVVAGDAKGNIETAQEPIPDDISFASAEDYDISSDESLMNVRVAIRTSGRWNDDLERRWRTWKDEEAKIVERYNEERDYFINEPEKHPCYAEEWMKFWDRRCGELEEQGIDTENYDFQREWMPAWLKRMQEIMLEKVEQQVLELKRGFRIDKHTLRRLYGISEADTRRKKLKKKHKFGQGNASSLKSSEQAGSSGPSHKQYLPPSTPQQTFPSNKAHQKPSCLPTPPHTNEAVRSNERHFNNNNQRKPGPKCKSPNISTPMHDSSSNSNLNLANNDKGDFSSINDESNSNDVKHNNLDSIIENTSQVSSGEPPPPGEENVITRIAPPLQNPGEVDKSEVITNVHEPASRIGETNKKDFQRRDSKNRDSRDDRHDSHKRDRDRDGHRRDRDHDHKHRRDRDHHSRHHRDDRHKRDKDERYRHEDERRREKESRRREDDRKRKDRSRDRNEGSRSVDERSRDFDERSRDQDESSRDREEPRRRISKASRTMSGNSEGESRSEKVAKKSDDDDKVSSVSSNTRTLQERLRALREALAIEEVMAKKPVQSFLPKEPVSTVDPPTCGPATATTTTETQMRSATPEDGEVASDISSEAFDPQAPTQGISTFIDKDLPGFHNFKGKQGAEIPVQHSNKNSFDRHAMDRKGSFNKHDNNSRPINDFPFSKSNKKKRRDKNHRGGHNQYHGGFQGGYPPNQQNNYHSLGRGTPGTAVRGKNKHSTWKANPIPTVSSNNPFATTTYAQEESWATESWEPSVSAQPSGPPQPFAPMQPPVPDFGQQIPSLMHPQLPPANNDWGSSGWDNSNYNQYNDWQ